MRLILAILFALITSPVWAADVSLSWDPSDNATGYRIYTSTDGGQTWDSGVDVGDVTEYTYTGVPDSGLVLFRVSAYNSSAEAIRYEAGAWYCAPWQPPNHPTGVGVE